jgi:uncharacterized protein (DUF427 family)
VIELHPQRVVVSAGGKVIADSNRALALHEAGGPSVLYIPRRDVAMHALQRSGTASYCPYKGEASHFSISEEGRRREDAAWAYDAPYWAVAEIENHVAFNPQLVDRIEVH